MLVWKVYGQRLDGWANDDFPSPRVPGDPDTLELAGEPLSNTQRNRDRSDLDFRGSEMPPAEAVREGKVRPLSDEDRRTLVRWIDLGCPIDFDDSPDTPARRGLGWMCDDKRPTLTINQPARGSNPKLDRIVVGMYDYYSGLVNDSFEVMADFEVAGAAPGINLASKFRLASPGVWSLDLEQPIVQLKRSTLRVRVRDRQGNWTDVERTFSVGPPR